LNIPRDPRRILPAGRRDPMVKRRKPVRLDDQLKRLGCVRPSEPLTMVERSGLIRVDGKGYTELRIVAPGPVLQPAEYTWAEGPCEIEVET